MKRWFISFAVVWFIVFGLFSFGSVATGASAHQVTITGFGENSGEVRVVSSPSGIDCPGECSAEFPAGTPVNLVAHLGSKTSFEGFWFYERYTGPNGNELPGNCRGQGNEGDQCYLPGTDDAVLNLQHYLIPEPGISGISINDGDVFTNDPKVELTVRWQYGSAYMTFSNDGGFGKSKQFDLKFKVPWTLQSSGPERLPKTVYALFNGGGTRYTDDIILDETPPALLSASASTGSGGASASTVTAPRSLASASRVRRVTLRVKARDKTSGVARIQVGARKSKKLKKMKFKRKLRVRSSARRLWVRVFDRAGNASRWKRVRVR